MAVERMYNKENLVKRILKSVIVMNVAVEDGKKADDICFLRAEFLSTMFLDVMKDLFVMDSDSDSD
ncbi:hypothetical protein YC2023_073200 [Brassica napus]